LTSPRQNIWSYPLRASAQVSVRAGVRVTRGTYGGFGQPDVSPDGKWLAFNGPNGLSKMPLPDGEAEPFADAPAGGYLPAWSPDGREIALSVNGDSSTEVVVMPATGGRPDTVTHAAGYNGDVRWSADGRHIAFMSTRMGLAQTWVLSRDSVGGAWHPEVQLTDSESYVRDWAPDGSGILCGSGARFSALRIESLQKRVVWKRDLAEVGLGGISSARFSRDGKTLYVVAMHRDGRRGVWAVPVSGGPVRLVVAFDDPMLFVDVVPALAVGRDRLYFVVGELESNIWVAKLHW